MFVTTPPRQTKASPVFHPLQNFFAQLTSAVARQASPQTGAASGAVAANVVIERKPMGFFKRLGQHIEHREMKRQEAYLAESTDIYDLEHRMKQLQYMHNTY